MLLQFKSQRLSSAKLAQLSAGTVSKMADKASAIISSSSTNAVQTSSSTTNVANVSSISNADTKVRTAGASLSEFLAHLEDYTPTVSWFSSS